MTNRPRPESADSGRPLVKGSQSCFHAVLSRTRFRGWAATSTKITITFTLIEVNLCSTVVPVAFDVSLRSYRGARLKYKPARTAPPTKLPVTSCPTER